MAGSVVLGVVGSPSDAESVVNDLTEQDFPERSISVVTANESDARAIIGDGGPLRGVTGDRLAGSLQSLGMASGDASAYSSAVRSGAAVVAVSASSATADAIRQTLESAGARQIQEIGEGA